MADRPPLVLGSSSPRRRQLLQQAGYQFTVHPPDPSAECGLCSGEAPHEFAARQALQKARDVAQHYETAIVIGCDTVAECMGQILGKPQDHRHARQMLSLMRGRPHRVLSGLCLWRRPDDRMLVEVDVTLLRMAEVTDQQLEAHLDSGDWRGKAGAFGFQDGLDWIQVEEGSVSNVVGLPLERLEKMLARLEQGG